MLHLTATVAFMVPVIILFAGAWFLYLAMTGGSE
jgi:hypothetical protein